MQERIFEQYAYTLDCLADEPETDDPEARSRLLRACANGARDAQKIVAALSANTLAEELVPRFCGVPLERRVGRQCAHSYLGRKPARTHETVHVINGMNIHPTAKGRSSTWKNGPNFRDGTSQMM